MLYEYIDEILRLKKEKGISYKELALETGIHENTIQKFLKGEIITSAENFLLICEVVGLNLWQKDTVKKLEDRVAKHGRLESVYEAKQDGQKAREERIIKDTYKDAIKLVKGE